MARLLVCAQTYPYPADQGGRIRYAHFLEALQHAHDVRLILIRRESDASRYPAPEATDVTFSPGRVFRNSLRSALSGTPVQFGAFVDRRSGAVVERLARDADAFVAFEPRAGLHHRFVPRETPKIIDLPDSPVLAARAQSAAGGGFTRRLRAMDNAVKVARLEREIVRAFEVVCVAGPADAARIAEGAPRADTRVVPTPIAVPRIASALSSEPLVLFSGDLSFAPNIDAARYLITEVWPRLLRLAPAARLAIVGHEPDPAFRRFLDASGCETAYSVPDLTPYLERARVIVAPMRIGSGIKVKVLTAFAAGRPVVMTPLANEAIDAAPESEALIGEDAAQLATGIERLLRDDALALRLGSAGRALVEARFLPRTVAERFVEAVSDALDRRGARRNQS